MSVIREWQERDAIELSKMLSNKKIVDNLRDGLPYPYTEKDGLEYIKAMLSADKKDVFCFAVTDGEKAIGNIGVFRQNNIHFRTGELGYYLAEEYWGQGYMTAAVKEVCDYVFSRSDILRIYAEVFSDNIGSCRVLEKAAFTLEGTLKKGAVKNGEIKDMKMYALVRNEGEKK